MSHSISKEETMMTKIIAALSVLLMLAVACSSEESVASTVDIEATVEARVATAIASQLATTAKPAPTPEPTSTATPVPEPTPTVAPTSTSVPTATATATPTQTKLLGIDFTIVDQAGFGDTPATYPIDVSPVWGNQESIDEASKQCEEHFIGGRSWYGCGWDPKVGYWVKGARTYLVKATNPNPFPVFLDMEVENSEIQGSRVRSVRTIIGEQVERNGSLGWGNTDTCSVVNEKGKLVEDIGIRTSSWIFQLRKLGEYEVWKGPFPRSNLHLGPGESNYFEIVIKANPRNTGNRLDFTVSESVYFNGLCPFHDTSDYLKPPSLGITNNNEGWISYLDGTSEAGIANNNEGWISYMDGTSEAPNGWIQLKDLPDEVSLHKVKYELDSGVTIEVGRLENRSEKIWDYYYSCTWLLEPDLGRFPSARSMSNIIPGFLTTDYEKHAFWINRGSMPGSIQNPYNLLRRHVSPGEFVNFEINSSVTRSLLRLPDWVSGLRNIPDSYAPCVDQSLDPLWFRER
jgi:hypothetical protein